MELEKKFDQIKEGKGPNFARTFPPLSIIFINSFESIEDAKKENVKVYEILSQIFGRENVEMDKGRYYEVKQENTPKNAIFPSQIPNEVPKYIAYSLLCTKKARYIGMTKNLKTTLKMHKEGKMGSFTKSYRPIKFDVTKYCDTEREAKIFQIEILDELQHKYGNFIRIYTEFIDSKPDKRVVWEDKIPPADEKLFENTPAGPNINFWVYVLECEESKYYVGYTSNLRKRFDEHASGPGGSNQTYYYKPICVRHIEGYIDAQSAKEAEKNWTLDLKKLKGKNNVRGFWMETSDPGIIYLGHDLLENWEIKNPKAKEV